MQNTHINNHTLHKKTEKKKETIIYQAKNGAIELRGDFSRETVWATQAQIVSLFDVDQSVVSRHINNIFKDGEIDKKSNTKALSKAKRFGNIFDHIL